MVDRAKVTENVQFGVEAVEGTAVPATVNIRSVSVDTKIPATADMFRPDGRKFNTLSMNNMEWSSIAVNGKGTYTEIDYLLGMAFGDPAPSTVTSGVYQRIYEMLDTTILVPSARTVEKGNSVRAQRISGAIMHDVVLAFGRKTGVALTGAGIGRLFEDGITLTADPDDVLLKPIVGKHLDIYVDAAAADLGTTKLLRAFSLENSLTGIFGPIWAINSAEASYSGHVDLAPTTSNKFMLEADAAGMAYLSQYRSDDQIFVRIEGTGADIVSGHPYLFTYDTCLAIKSLEPDTDEDGVTTVSYDCELVKDSTWGKALEITTINNIPDFT